ncbi:ketosteroid isomerase family protein [Streptosporangium subroseum]|nr:ketosteroid isomerase family protein [Streptosporangium subroseum]
MAPDAASESAIEHVFRARHEAVPAQDADKIADLYAADDVIETPAAVLLSGDMGSGVVQGRESIRAFFAGSFAVRRREGIFENWVAYRDLLHRRASVDLGVPAPDTDGRTDPTSSSAWTSSTDSSRVHLVCWGWVGFKKLHAAANNTPPTG